LKEPLSRLKDEFFSSVETQNISGILQFISVVIFFDCNQDVVEFSDCGG
jgi:hypothetical protein